MKKIIIILLFCIITFSAVFAESTGTEFWFSVPPAAGSDLSNSNIVTHIYVCSVYKTKVTLSLPYLGFSETQNTIPNGIIHFDLTPTQAQPWVKNPQAPNLPEMIFPGKGIHLKAEAPVIVYCRVECNKGGEAFYCLPVSALGTEYITAGQETDAMMRAIWNIKTPDIVNVTAVYDNTKVRFTLGGNVVSKTAGGMKPGDLKEWTLNQGDVISISADPDESTLSGSKIVSTLPVAVNTGNMWTNVPTGDQWPNYITEMPQPTNKWGNYYILPAPINRKFSSLMRIFAKEDETKIYRDGRPIGIIPNSGGVEGRGYLSMRQTADMKPASVVMSSEKPISVSLYNTGSQEDGISTEFPSPYQMMITPVEQFSKETIFFTPANSINQYGYHYVYLVYQIDEYGGMSDSIYIAGPSNGTDLVTMSELKNKFPGQDELLKIKINGLQYAIRQIILPGVGVYKIKSNTPFGLYSIGNVDSCFYALPTTNIAYSSLSVVYPVIVPDTLNFGNPSVGEQVTKEFTIINPSDSLTCHISTIGLRNSNSYYSLDMNGNSLPLTLNPKGTVKMKATYNRTGGDSQINDISLGDTTWFINACHLMPEITYPVIVSQDIDFGLRDNKISYDTLIEIKNTGNATLWIIDFAGPNSSVFDFKGSFYKNYYLSPGMSITIPITLKSTNYQGVISDSIIVRSNASSKDSIIYLNARLLDFIQIEVSDVQFIQTVPGNVETYNAYVKNPGLKQLKLYGIEQPALVYFTTNFPYIMNYLSPYILEPGQKVGFPIYFKAPQQYNQNFTDKITLNSNANIGDSVCIINATTYTSVNEPLNTGLFTIDIDKSQNEMNIKISDNTTILADFEILDISGKSVCSGKFSEGGLFTVIHINNLTNGLYLLRIQTNQGDVLKKFSIVR